MSNDTPMTMERLQHLTYAASVSACMKPEFLKGLAETHPSALIRALATELATLRERLAAADGHLRFVERWANHHAQKPCVKPEHALSTIQHYPPILAITRSYADGKVPETENPWERALAAEALAEQNAKDAERLDWLEARPNAVTVNWFVIGTLAPTTGEKQTIRQLIDAARSAT